MENQYQSLTDDELKRIVEEVKTALSGTSLEDKRGNLSEFLKCHIDCVEIVRDFNPKNDWNIVFLKSLHDKIILASSSIIALSNGYEFKKGKRKEEIIDTPSIIILKRSIIECFLIMEYLYYNELSEEENEFRFKLYMHSGLLARHKHYTKGNLLHQEKFETESKVIERLKGEIMNYSFFGNINKSQRWKFDKYGISRLETWEGLIEKSSLNTSLFSKQYTLSTNYAHSEFISAMQIRESNYQLSSKYNNELTELEIDILRMINSLSIRKLCSMFSDAESEFKKNKSELKFQLNSWANIASGSYI
jgi:hypothetical protein